MYKEKKVTSIILAAGSGSRFGTEKNKVYLEIKGKEILAYSIEEYMKNEYIDEIIVVIKKGEEEIFNETLEKIFNRLTNFKNVKTVYGGETRNDSVYNGLKEAEGEIVTIHDGARPFLKQKHISEEIEQMENYNGAIIGVRSKDTVKMVNEFSVVDKTVERKKLWNTQTPQCFNKKILMKAHETDFGSQEITDDSMLLEMLGEKVKVLEGEYTNIKITTKEDIILAEVFLNNM